MDTQNLKSRDCLTSFIRHCVTHPDERFWQALVNWSGYTLIKTYDSVRESGHDTFYLEGRRHDESKSPSEHC